MPRIFLALMMLAGSCWAWPVQTNRITVNVDAGLRSYSYAVPQGESHDFIFSYVYSNGVAVNLTNYPVRYLYQYRGMTSWWTIDAIVVPTAGVATVKWDQGRDPGYQRYLGWLYVGTITGPVYRVQMDLSMTTTPGFVPNATNLHLAPIDWNDLTWTNEPWVEEAPEDGTAYARKDGAWDPVGSSVIDSDARAAASNAQATADAAYGAVSNLPPIPEDSGDLADLGGIVGATIEEGAETGVTTNSGILAFTVGESGAGTLTAIEINNITGNVSEGTATVSLVARDVDAVKGEVLGDDNEYATLGYSSLPSDPFPRGGALRMYVPALSNYWLMFPDADGLSFEYSIENKGYHPLLATNEHPYAQPGQVFIADGIGPNANGTFIDPPWLLPDGDGSGLSNLPAGGSTYDQNLNTTNEVKFARVTIGSTDGPVSGQLRVISDNSNELVLFGNNQDGWSIAKNGDASASAEAFTMDEQTNAVWSGLLNGTESDRIVALAAGQLSTSNTLQNNQGETIIRQTGSFAGDGVLTIGDTAGYQLGNRWSLSLSSVDNESIWGNKGSGATNWLILSGDDYLEHQQGSNVFRIADGVVSMNGVDLAASGSVATNIPWAAAATLANAETVTVDFSTSASLVDYLAPTSATTMAWSLPAGIGIGRKVLMFAPVATNVSVLWPTNLWSGATLFSLSSITNTVLSASVIATPQGTNRVELLKWNIVP